MKDIVIKYNNNDEAPGGITYSEVVDMPLSSFKKFCEGKNATELLGLKKLFSITYNQVELAKEMIVDKMMKDSKVKESSEYKGTLTDLYDLMQRLEDKAVYVCVLLKTPT